MWGVAYMLPTYCFYTDDTLRLNYYEDSNAAFDLEGLDPISSTRFR